MGNQASTYFFIGRLGSSPLRFQVQDADAGDGLRLDVYLDAISAWGTTVEPFDTFRVAVRTTLDFIVAAYAFKARHALDYRLDNWVEVKGVIGNAGIVGRFLAPNEAPPTLPSTRSPTNTPWKLAARLNRSRLAGGVTQNHVLALRDYQQAMLDPSDNAFFFAWRAVEDVCRTVANVTDVSAAAWGTMNVALNTTQQMTQPLNDASIAVRHNVMSPQRQAQLAAARANRAQTLNIAHQVVDAEMHRTFPWF